MKIQKTIFIIIFSVFIFIIYQNLMALRNGIVGLTKKGGNKTGCVCHDFKPNDTVSVVISGPNTVRANDTAIYTLRISNGPAVAGGCDISTSLGNVYTSVLDTTLRRAEAFTGAGFELTHKEPKLFLSDTLQFTFKYVAPDTSNVIDTIFANGNSVNNDTTSKNDIWNYADDFLISVTPDVGIANNNIITKSFELLQNYPNPFNPETKINFNINKASDITFTVYDLTGKTVSKLIDNKFYTAGTYSLVFNAQQYNLTSGVYFYKLTTNEFSDIKEMMLVK
jgi:Secretion system C-terminal sorting domain